MYRMADSIARRIVPDAKTPAGASKKQVIVGVLEILLNQVVIEILSRNLGPDPIEAHRFQFEHDKSASRVLR